MIGVLGHYSALLRLYWAADKLGRKGEREAKGTGKERKRER